MKTAESIEAQEERKQRKRSKALDSDRIAEMQADLRRRNAIAADPSLRPRIRLNERVPGSVRDKQANKPLKEIYAQGHNPNSHTTVGKRNNSIFIKPYQYPPGTSGNPKGRPPRDTAATIARQVFDNNQEALYKAYSRAALKGNAYAFKELADRAFGKVKDKVEYEVTQFREVSEKALIERLEQLEQSLGFAGSRESVGGSRSDQEGTPTPALQKTN